MRRRMVYLAPFIVLCGLAALESCVSDAPIGSDAGSDAMMSDGGDGGCALSTCGSACVDLQSDPMNCGGCGKPCPASDKCSEGVCGGAKAVSISAGAFCSFVVLASGSLWAWGLGENAQLGVAPSDLQQACTGFSLNLKCRSAPTPVPGITNAKAVSAFGSAACALERDGSVFCWSNNTNGQLGHVPGSTNDITCSGTACNPKPSAVAIPPAGGIAMGQNAACAVITSSGDVYCWGRDHVGQASGTLPSNPMSILGPMKVPLPARATQVVAGASYACAVLESSEMWCWGGNSIGQLGHASGTLNDRTPCFGDGGGGAPCSPPTAVRDSMNATFTDAFANTATAGGATTCVGTSGSKLWCWGAGDSAQFGASMPTDSPSPLQIPGSFVYAGIADFGCASTPTSDVSCWGLNELGSIGLGTTDAGGPCAFDPTYHCVTPPATVPSVKARRIAVGASFTLAMTIDGRVWGWGLNHFGQAGHPPGTHGDVMNTTMTGNSGWVAMSPIIAEGLPLP